MLETVHSVVFAAFSAQRPCMECKCLTATKNRHEVSIVYCTNQTKRLMQTIEQSRPGPDFAGEGPGPTLGMDRR